MINRVILEGYLVKDNIVNTTGKKPYLFNTVAINSANDKYSSKFIPIMAFGDDANRIARYGSKGSLINLIGEIDIETSKDNSGQWKTNAKVIVRKINFLEKKEEQPKEFKLVQDYQAEQEWMEKKFVVQGQFTPEQPKDELNLDDIFGDSK